MTPDGHTVPAPVGAICWSPTDGWIFDADDAQRALTDTGWALVVASDGRVHGIDPDEAAPLPSVLRVDATVVGLAAQLADLQRMHARLAERVAETRGHLDQHRADVAVEVAAVKERVSRLERRMR